MLWWKVLGPEIHVDVLRPMKPTQTFFRVTLQRGSGFLGTHDRRLELLFHIPQTVLKYFDKIL